MTDPNDPVVLDSPTFSENTPNSKVKKISSNTTTPTAQPQIPTILKCYEYDEENLNSPENVVSCKGCSKKIAFKLGDPSSNLLRHIAKSNSFVLKHEALLKDYYALQPSPARVVKRKLEEIENKPNLISQKNITSFEEYKSSDPKKINLDLKLCNLIVSKSLPLSLVDEKEYRSYSNTLDPRYKPPNSQTLKGTIIPKCKNELKDYFIEKLGKISSANLVTDLWTDPAMRSFIGFDVMGIIAVKSLHRDIRSYHLN
jgi:hypothetical protein